MPNNAVVERILELKVVPVITLDDPNLAAPLADALIAGDLPMAEIALRTPASLEGIAKLKRHAPDVLLGAGTVLTVDQLVAARNAGVEFAVTPGFSPSVVRKAVEMELPIVPGVATPSEIQLALEHGQKLLKFFPASCYGGVKTLKALSGPYGPAGVQFMPTGGVNADNLAEYLALSSVVAVGGGWLAPRQAIEEQRWDDIAERCRQARAIAMQNDP